MAAPVRAFLILALLGASSFISFVFLCTIFKTLKIFTVQFTLCDKRINFLGNSRKGLNSFTSGAGGTRSLHKSYSGPADADHLEMEVFVSRGFYLGHIILHL